LRRLRKRAQREEGGQQRQQHGQARHFFSSAHAAGGKERTRSKRTEKRVKKKKGAFLNEKAAPWQVCATHTVHETEKGGSWREWGGIIQCVLRRQFAANMMSLNSPHPYRYLRVFESFTTPHVTQAFGERLGNKERQ
jgi:hypothetical protein